MATVIGDIVAETAFPPNLLNTFCFHLLLFSYGDGFVL